MRSLRINGTNAHNIQVQNNVDIYKRLVLNRNNNILLESDYLLNKVLNPYRGSLYFENFYKLPR